LGAEADVEMLANQITLFVDLRCVIVALALFKSPMLG